MQEQKQSLTILTSPGFLLGLSLLLLNDFVLKAAFHNWLTGKLSDFAGLFIFSLFFTAFFPQRKAGVYAATAIGFVFWKSEYSQPLITLWNSQPYYNVDRVIDYTDLIVLAVLPLSFRYSKRTTHCSLKPLLIYVGCAISVFAFAATSFVRQKTTYIKEYQFGIPQVMLINRIAQLSELRFYRRVGSDSKSDFRFYLEQALPISFEINFAEHRFGNARIIVIAERNTSKISLISTEVERATKLTHNDKVELLHYFEREFIEELRKEPVRASSQIRGIWFRN